MWITEEEQQEITIIGYEGRGSMITIPEEIQGRPVTKIGTGAFRGFGELAVIQLPRTLKTIGDYSFCECRSLEEIVIPSGVTVVGSHSFYNCRGLRRLSIPNTLEGIGDGFIKNCDAIGEITIDSWKNISSGVVALLNEYKQFFYLKIKDIQVQLVFPEYDFEYISNAPAMRCHTVTHGAGESYRRAIESRSIDFAGYDGSFAKAVVEEKAQTVIDIIGRRLEFPFALSEQQKASYVQYLQGQMKDIVAYSARMNDVNLLELFKHHGVFTHENIEIAAAQAASMGNSEVSAFLLDLRLSVFLKKRKSFDL